MRSEIRHAMRPFIRRLRLAQLLLALTDAVGAVIAGGAVLLSLAEFRLLPRGAVIWLIPLFALVLTASLLIRFPGRMAAAKRIDAQYSLRDRAATMVHLSDDDGFFAGIQRQDTIARLGQLDAKELRTAIPLRRWIALLLIAAVSAGAYLSCGFAAGALRARQAQTAETEEMKLARAILDEMRARLENADLTDEERARLLAEIENAENEMNNPDFGVEELAGITQTVGELKDYLDASEIRRGWIYLLREEPHYTAVADGMISEDIPAMQAALVENYAYVSNKTGTEQIIALMDLKTEIDDALEADNEPDDRDAYLQYTFLMFADDMLGAANMNASHKDPSQTIFTAFRLLEKRLISIINGVETVTEADEDEETVYYQNPDSEEAGDEENRGGRASDEQDGAQDGVLLYTSDPDGMQGAGTGTRNQQHYQESAQIYEPSLDPYSAAYDPAREYEFERSGITIENGHVAYGQVYGSYYARMIEAIAEGLIPEDMRRVIEAYFFGL